MKSFYSKPLTLTKQKKRIRQKLNFKLKLFEFENFHTFGLTLNGRPKPNIIFLFLISLNNKEYAREIINSMFFSYFYLFLHVLLLWQRLLHNKFAFLQEHFLIQPLKQLQCLWPEISYCI